MDGYQANQAAQLRVYGYQARQAGQLSVNDLQARQAAHLSVNDLQARQAGLQDERHSHLLAQSASMAVQVAVDVPLQVKGSRHMHASGRQVLKHISIGMMIKHHSDPPVMERWQLPTTLSWCLLTCWDGHTHIHSAPL